MPKNKVFFEVNIPKETIKEFIKIQVDSTEDGLITDELLDSSFIGIINRIAEESLEDMKLLYHNKDYNFVQIKMVGLTEEPKKLAKVKFNEDNTEIIKG